MQASGNPTRRLEDCHILTPVISRLLRRLCKGKDCSQALKGSGETSNSNPGRFGCLPRKHDGTSHSYAPTTRASESSVLGFQLENASER